MEPEWIKTLCRRRIRGRFKNKYGPWSPASFKDRDPRVEDIYELIDSLNYGQMAFKMKLVSEEFYERKTALLWKLLEELKEIINNNPK